MILQPKERTIVVTAPFMYEGEATKIGQTMTVSFSFAAEMVHANKAVYPADDVPPQPVKIEPAPPAPNTLPPDRYAADKKGK